MLSINEYSTEDERRKFFKEKANMLADSNGVKINIVSLEEHIQFYYLYGNPSARSIFIHEGDIYINKDYDEKNIVEYELVFHELLHILSVPKRYRYLMCNDTEKSYKKIKEKFIDKNKISTESAVIGAQYILYTQINATGWLGGSFFRGHIRVLIKDNSYTTDVPKEYQDRGRKLLRRLNLASLV
jgi:lipid II:glycine glycyltransferase (peptidoglycan interpeptide bridge formation enzyme)